MHPCIDPLSLRDFPWGELLCDRPNLRSKALQCLFHRCSLGFNIIPNLPFSASGNFMQCSGCQLLLVLYRPFMAVIMIKG